MGLIPIFVANLSRTALIRQRCEEQPDGISFGCAIKAIGNFIEILDANEGSQAKAIIITETLNEVDMALCEGALQTLPFQISLSDFAPCEGTLWAWLRWPISWPKGSSEPKGCDIPRIAPPKQYRWKTSTEAVIQAPWEKVTNKSFMKLELKGIGSSAEKASGAGDSILEKRKRNDDADQPMNLYGDDNMVRSNRSGERRLWVAEEERLFGFPDGASNFIEKLPDEPRIDRQIRRRNLLAASLPVRVLIFLMEAVAVASSEIQHCDPLPYGIDDIIDSRVYGTCLFISSRLVEGASGPDYLGPDACEMDSLIYGFLAEGSQARRMPSRATPLMAVPAGISPMEHFESGLAAQSPLEQDIDTEHFDH